MISHTFFYLRTKYIIDFKCDKKAFVKYLVDQGYSKAQIAEIGAMERKVMDNIPINHGKVFEVKDEKKQ